VAAIALSYHFDFPTGHTMVFCNSLLALVAVGLRSQKSSEAAG